MAEFDFSQIEAFVSNLSINVSNMDQILRDFSTKTNDAAKEADKLKDTISKTSDNIKKFDTGNIIKELNSFKGEISNGIDVFSKMTSNAGNVLEKFHKLAQNTSDITNQFAGLRSQLEGIDVSANFDQVNSKLQSLFDDFDLSDISSDINLKIQSAIGGADFTKITNSLKDLADKFENMPNLIPIDEIRRSITNIRENLDELPTKVVDENLKGIISERVDAIGTQLDMLQEHFRSIDISPLKDQLNSLNETPFGEIATKFEQLFQTLNDIDAQLTGSFQTALTNLSSVINPKIEGMITNLRDTIGSLITELQNVEKEADTGIIENLTEVNQTLSWVLERFDQSNMIQSENTAEVISRLDSLQDNLERQIELLGDFDFDPDTDPSVTASQFKSVEGALKNIITAIKSRDLPNATQINDVLEKLGTLDSGISKIISEIRRNTKEIISKFPEDLGPSAPTSIMGPVPSGPAAAAAPRKSISALEEVPESLRGITDAIENVQIDPEMKRIFKKLSQQDPVKLDQEPLQFFEDFVTTARESGKLNEKQVKNLEDLSERLGKLVKYSDDQNKASRFLSRTLEKEFAGIDRRLSSTYQGTLKTLEKIKDRQESVRDVIDETSESSSNEISSNQRVMINALVTLAKDNNIRSADLLKELGYLEKSNQELIRNLDSSVGGLISFMNADLPKAKDFDSLRSSINSLPKPLRESVINAVAKEQAEQEKRSNASIDVAKRQVEIAEELRKQLQIASAEGSQLGELIDTRLGDIDDSIASVESSDDSGFSVAESAFGDLLSKFETGVLAGMNAREIRREIIKASRQELENIIGGPEAVAALEKKSPEVLEDLSNRLEIGFTESFKDYLQSIETARATSPKIPDKGESEVLRKLSGIEITPEAIQKRLVDELRSLDDLIKTASSEEDIPRAIIQALDLKEKFSGLEDVLTLESRETLAGLHRALGDIKLTTDLEGFVNLYDTFDRFIDELPASFKQGLAETEGKLDEMQGTTEQVAQQQAEQTEAIEMSARAAATAADQNVEAIEENSSFQQEDLGRAVNTLQNVEDSLEAVAQGEGRGEAREAGLMRVNIEGAEELGERFATAQQEATDEMIRETAANAEKERSILEQAAEADAAAAAQFAESNEDLIPYLESMDRGISELNRKIDQGSRETTRYRSE